MTDQKNKLLSHEDVCEWLKISRQTLWVWRKERAFPTALWDMSARGLRWRRADVDAWLEEHGEELDCD